MKRNMPTFRKSRAVQNPTASGIAVKVQPAFKTHSKEEEKPFKSDLEKRKKHKKVDNTNPSFFYNV